MDASEPPLDLFECIHSYYADDPDTHEFEWVDRCSGGDGAGDSAA